jgi:hypothetical protein
MSRIWIDVSGIRQANMLASLARSTRARAELLVTTSDSRSEDIMRFSSLQTIRVSSEDPDPLQSYADRVLRLSRKIEEFKPDLLISDLDPAAVRTAFGLGVPAWAIYANGSGKSPVDAQRRMSYPLCEKVFASNFFERKKIAMEGLPKSRVVTFQGFNECYLKPEREPGGPTASRIPRILIRPNGQDPPNWLRDATQCLLDGIEKAKVTILGAKDSTSSMLSGLGRRVRLIEFMPYPPVLRQDLFVGWGRMLGESFVLGIPSVRIGHESHPDLSLAYSHQPAMTEPCSIVSAFRRMLDDGPKPDPIDGLRSPIDVVVSELTRQGIL